MNAEMIARAIREGSLTAEEEVGIRDLLEHRAHHMQDGTLAGYMDLAAAEKAHKQGCAIDAYNSVFKYYLQGIVPANKNVSEFTEYDLKVSILVAAEKDGYSEKEWLLFLNVLQAALDNMNRKGILGFAPPIDMDKHLREKMKKRRWIGNPYADRELAKITGYLEKRKYDAQALALRFWLQGGITLEDTANLKTDYLYGVRHIGVDVLKKNETEDYLPLSKKRKQIIKAALELHHGTEQEYIFMDAKEGMLQKVMLNSLSLKMMHICNRVGAVYTPIKQSDAILWH